MKNKKSNIKMKNKIANIKTKNKRTNRKIKYKRTNMKTAFFYPKGYCSNHQDSGKFVLTGILSIFNTSSSKFSSSSKGC